MASFVVFGFPGCQNSLTDPTNSRTPDLGSLTLSDGVLYPSFSAGIRAYNVSVANAVTSMTVTGTTAEDSDTLSANNGVAQPLSVGANTITIAVTARDGITKQDYVVTVYRNGETPVDYTSAKIKTLKGVPSGTFHRDATAGNISTVSAYRMSQYEITRAQFLSVMGADPSNTTYSTGVDDPVQNVSWYAAIAFCNKLSLSEGLEPVYAVTGVDFSTLTYAQIPTSSDASWNAAIASWGKDGYRLPSEMEWMWAAMGAMDDRTKAFSGSNGSNSMGDYAVFGYGKNEEGSTLSSSSKAVGSKLPNELLIHDLSGNILEYCWDYSASYPNGSITDYRGPASGTNRVCRGGSWAWNASWAAIAYRGSTGMPGSGYVMGFRVARN